MPKGVVLTHINFVSVIASAIAQGTILPRPTDIVIAYLPLAHILELLVEVRLSDEEHSRFMLTQFSAADSTEIRNACLHTLVLQVQLTLYARSRALRPARDGFRDSHG